MRKKFNPASPVYQLASFASIEAINTAAVMAEGGKVHFEDFEAALSTWLDDFGREELECYAEDTDADVFAAAALNDWYGVNYDWYYPTADFLEAARSLAVDLYQARAPREWVAVLGANEWVCGLVAPAFETGRL